MNHGMIQSVRVSHTYEDREYFQKYDCFWVCFLQKHASYLCKCYMVT